MKKTYFKKKLVITIITMLFFVTISAMNVASDDNSSYNGRIVFASNRSGTWDLWMMNIDGTELIQLTTNEGADVSPDISPDGKKIVFISGRTGYPQPWILDLESGEERQLFDVLELPIPYDYPINTDYIKWHPSGEYIISQITLMGIHPSPWASMYRCDPDGSNVETFLNLGPSIKGKWDISSDGARLAYCRESSNYNAYTLRITIGNIVNGVVDHSSLYDLEVTNDGKRDKGVSWYLNDEKLLWRKYKNPSNLVTANSDGSDLQQLTFFTSGGGSVEAEVSYDNEKIIYNLLKIGVHPSGYDWWGINAGDIYMIDIDGSNNQLIIGDDGFYYQCPVWVPIINVDIDIKPGSYPNSINIYSKGKVPVAVLTDDDFDASVVDPDSIVFLDASPVHWALEDLDDDSDLDMILQFKTQELDFNLVVDEGGKYPYAYLNGETNSGESIEGKDTVRLVGQTSYTIMDWITEHYPILINFFQRFPFFEKILHQII